jgi:hypothetical protein
MLKLPGHSRYAYSPIVERKDYSGREASGSPSMLRSTSSHFAFDTGFGMDPSNRGNGQHFVVAHCSRLRTHTPSALLDWPRSVETRSSFRKWVDVLGNGALRISARIVVPTGSILNRYVQLLRSL